MENDWRLTDQLDYMKAISLKKISFNESAHSEHEHCEFCFKKFGKAIDMLHNGYCTLDEYRWICEDCYEDFKEMFQWVLICD